LLTAEIFLQRKNAGGKITFPSLKNFPLALNEQQEEE